MRRDTKQRQEWLDAAWLMISTAFGIGHEHNMAYESSATNLIDELT